MENIWRCRVAGRARTIGNRVYLKRVSRVRISPSPPEPANSIDAIGWKPCVSTVCGLFVPRNLKILPTDANRLFPEAEVTWTPDLAKWRKGHCGIPRFIIPTGIRHTTQNMLRNFVGNEQTQKSSCRCMETPILACAHFENGWFKRGTGSSKLKKLQSSNAFSWLYGVEYS